MAGEIGARKDCPKALLLGVIGVIVLYVSANFIYVQALSPTGLAGTATAASAVISRALGSLGGSLIAIAIAVSTLGFLAQRCSGCPPRGFCDGGRRRAAGSVCAAGLAQPGAGCSDRAVGRVGCGAYVLLGTYEQILSYVVVMDWLFLGLIRELSFCFSGARRKAPWRRCCARTGISRSPDILGPPAYLSLLHDWWYSTPSINILAMQASLCVFFSPGSPFIPVPRPRRASAQFQMSIK